MNAVIKNECWLGCIPELDDMTLLLKMLHTLVPGHGKINTDQEASSFVG